MKKGKRKTPLLWVSVIVILIAAAAYFFIKSNEPPTVGIYFIKGEKLIEVKRPLPPNVSELAYAAEELMAGPGKAERDDGIFTEIPAGTKIISVGRSEAEAVITFSDELENYGGGSARVQGLVAQIVYTFTSIPGIQKVKIMVGKKESVVLGGEGFVIDRPLSREDVKL